MLSEARCVSELVDAGIEKPDATEAWDKIPEGRGRERRQKKWRVELLKADPPKREGMPGVGNMPKARAQVPGSPCYGALRCEAKRAIEW